jgi:hypothetical protein
MLSSWRMYEMHPALSLKTRVLQSPCVYKKGCPGPHEGEEKGGREGGYTHDKGTGEDGQGQTLSLSLALSYSLSRSRSLATLVTPTTSTLVQDNTRLIFPLCSISHQPI